MTTPASALYGGILTILIVFLSINVTRTRAATGVFFGDGGLDNLKRAIRAQGNAIEYVPLGILMLVIAEMNGANSVSMHGLGGTLLLARLVHVAGIIGSINAARTAGTGFTWLTLLGTAAYLFILRF